MAPTLLQRSPTTAHTQHFAKRSLGAESIVGLSIAAFFAVVITITLLGYYYHRRAERNKLPPDQRPVSYHPFRTASGAHSTTVKSSLLANAEPAPSDEDSNDKSSMFSRNRNSSLSLYVDSQVHTEKHKRVSVDTVSLIPLHITPAEESDRNPMDSMTGSTGTGVSSIRSNASRLSLGTTTTTTGGSLGMSQIPVPEQAGGYAGEGRITRPRSTSTTSVRYYESVNGSGSGNGSRVSTPPMPVPVPTIITTAEP